MLQKICSLNEKFHYKKKSVFLEFCNKMQTLFSVLYSNEASVFYKILLNLSGKSGAFNTANNQK